MKTIVCYGDSNTYGQNPEFSVDPSKPFRHAYETRWTGILQGLLGGSCRVIEEGLSGRTTVLDNPVELHRNGMKTLPACLMSHAPIDLLIVMLGTNDLRNCFTPIPFSIYNGMEALLNECQNPAWQIAGGQMKILLVSPPVVKEQRGQSPWPGLFEDWNAVPLSKQMADIFRTLAEKHDIYFLDASLYAEPSELDFVHLDPDNHRKLALAVCDKVQQILKV